MGSRLLQLQAAQARSRATPLASPKDMAAQGEGHSEPSPPPGEPQHGSQPDAEVDHVQSSERWCVGDSMMAAWGVRWCLTVGGGCKWTPEVLWFASQERCSCGFHGFLVAGRMRGIVQDGSGCLPPVLRHQVQPSPQSAGLTSRDGAGSGQGWVIQWALWEQAQGPTCTWRPRAPAKSKDKTNIFSSNASSLVSK